MAREKLPEHLVRSDSLHLRITPDERAMLNKLWKDNGFRSLTDFLISIARQYGDFKELGVQENNT